MSGLRLVTDHADHAEADAHVVALRRRVEACAARCEDAEAEFDAAVDAGYPMYVLVQRDQEVAAASRGHHEAVRDLRRATHGPRAGTLTVAAPH